MQPGFIFLGEQFEQESKYRVLKSMLIDLFRGSSDPEVSLTNIERMFICCAHPDGKVTIRHFCVKLKKSGTKVLISPKSNPTSTVIDTNGRVLQQHTL